MGLLFRGGLSSGYSLAVGRVHQYILTLVLSLFSAYCNLWCTGMKLTYQQRISLVLLVT